jgi:hypothetical protein
MAWSEHATGLRAAHRRAVPVVRVEDGDQHTRDPESRLQHIDGSAYRVHGLNSSRERHYAHAPAPASTAGVLRCSPRATRLLLRLLTLLAVPAAARAETVTESYRAPTAGGAQVYVEVTRQAGIKSRRSHAPKLHSASDTLWQFSRPRSAIENGR